MNAIITTTLSFFNMSGIKPNFSELAREYNIDRHTLKKHYDAGGYKERKKRIYSSYLDKYKSIIEEKLQIKGITYIGIYKYLVNEKGLKGTYSNFKAYLKTNNLAKPKFKITPHVRYETPPGKQLQVDWKESIKLTNKKGEIFEFNLFAACLSASRLHYFCFSESVTEESFIRCLIDTFYHIGGLPKEVLTDNMTAIVDVIKNKRYKHTKILQLEKDLSININLCKVKTPETKGKVESQNRFIARLLAYNNEFETKEELINIINKLNIDINNEPNGTTLVAPIVLFSKEKEYLSPIPSKCMIESYIADSVTCIVPPTLLVKYKGNEYSVPMKYINKRVKLIAIENKLHIYFNTNLITSHEISNKKINYLEEHYVDALKQNIKHSNYDIEKISKENLKLLDKGVFNNE